MHLLFIALVALVVLGPKRLPEVARALGKGVREFREAISAESSTPASTHLPSAPVAPAAATQHAAAVAQPVDPAPAHGDPLLAHGHDAQASAAQGSVVDPAQPVRSGDAPDRGSL